MVRWALAGLLLASPAQACVEAGSWRFPQPVPAGALIGRRLQQPIESQPILGRIDAIARDPAGCTVAIVSVGGGFGWRARRVAVPLPAMTLLGDATELVDLSPAQLAALPTYAGDATPLAAETTLSVGLSRPPH